jgi:hypothetical protein
MTERRWFGSGPPPVSVDYRACCIGCGLNGWLQQPR